MPFSELPSQEITLEQVFDVIIRTERRHRVVWTAGRILKEDGSLYRIATANPSKRKSVLRRIRSILKALVRKSVLAERGLQFNYGTTKEVSYDLVLPDQKLRPTAPGVAAELGVSGDFTPNQAYPHL